MVFQWVVKADKVRHIAKTIIKLQRAFFILKKMNKTFVNDSYGLRKDPV